MTAPSTISVVICAYTLGRWESLLAAVESVRQQDARAEIVVVVDHNEELLARSRTQLSGAVVVANRFGRGLSGARNSGVEVAKGEVVAFLDDDATARPGWLEGMRRAYTDGRVLAVGGSVWPRWGRQRPGWFPPEFDWVVGCSYRGLPTSPRPVRNLIGCNMSFRGSALREVGGFREEIGRVGTLPIGCEETELCIRLHIRWPEGIILYDPALAVDHAVPTMRASLPYFSSRCFAEGISKAAVSRLVGARHGLASERRHVVATLPLGVIRAVGSTFRRRDLWGPVRAVMVIAGLALTSAGYAAGIVSGWRRRPNLTRAS